MEGRKAEQQFVLHSGCGLRGSGWLGWLIALALSSSPLPLRAQSEQSEQSEHDAPASATAAATLSVEPQLETEQPGAGEAARATPEVSRPAPAVGPSRAAEPADQVAAVARVGRPGWAKALGMFGLTLDFGVSGMLPDAGLLLGFVPKDWVRLNFGVGYNGLAPGVRAGVSLVSPVFFPFTAALECGHYFDGDANRALHWFGRDDEILALKAFSYDYLNLLGGLTLTVGRVGVYLLGGVTWMSATITNFQQTVNQSTNVGLVASDPKATYRGPSAKLGVFFHY